MWLNYEHIMELPNLLCFFLISCTFVKKNKTMPKDSHNDTINAIIAKLDLLISQGKLHEAMALTMESSVLKKDTIFPKTATITTEVLDFSNFIQRIDLNTLALTTTLTLSIIGLADGERGRIVITKNNFHQIVFTGIDIEDFQVDIFNSTLVRLEVINQGGQLILKDLFSNSFFDQRVQESVDNTLPIGAIVMFNTASAPTNWAFCDGANGTPDLRGKFLVNLNTAETAFNTIGTTGGLKRVTLITTQIPSHTHAVTGGSHNHTASSNSAGNHSHSFNYSGSGTSGGSSGSNFSTARFVSQSGITESAGTHTHTITVNTLTSHTHTVSNTGNGVDHENLPPYYTIGFYQRIS